MMQSTCCPEDGKRYFFLARVDLNNLWQSSGDKKEFLTVRAVFDSRSNQFFRPQNRGEILPTFARLSMEEIFRNSMGTK